MQKSPKVRRRFAINANVFPRAWMKELKMRRVERDASNSPFRFFGWTILPVADHRVADRCQLNTDLIL